MSDSKLQEKDIQNLAANLQRLEITMAEGFKNVNTRLDIMNDHFIRKDLFDEKIKVLNSDIEELKDANKWLYRTIGAIVITILMTGSLLAFNLLK